MFENILTVVVGRNVRHTRLRYEDFVQNPMPVLQRALNDLGLTYNFEALDPGSLHLVPTHSVGGNPMRYTLQGLRVQLDDQWRRDWSAPTRFALSAFGLPVLLAFGYPPW
jgi:hypothetical protein